MAGRNAVLAAVAVFAVFLTAPAGAAAVEYTWSAGADGDWSNPINWNPAGVPASGDSVTIDTHAVDLSEASAVGDVTFLNGATLRTNSFDLEFDGGAAVSGEGTLEARASLGTSGTLTIGDGVTDTTLAITGNCWCIQTGRSVMIALSSTMTIAPNVVLSGGVAGPGAIFIEGTLKKLDGIASAVRIPTTIADSGKLKVTTGQLQFHDGTDPGTERILTNCEYVSAGRCDLRGGTYELGPGTGELWLGLPGEKIGEIDAEVNVEGTGAHIKAGDNLIATDNLVSIGIEGSLSIVDNNDFASASTLTNDGTLSLSGSTWFSTDANSTTDIINNGEFTSGADNINGGDTSAEIENGAEGTMTLAGGTVAGLTTAGSLTIAGAVEVASSSVVNSGQLTVNSGTSLTAPGFTQSDGTLKVAGGVTATPDPMEIDGGTLTGTGTIDASVTIGVAGAATVSPGASTGVGSMGTLSILQGLTFGSDGVYHADVASLASRDRLAVTGALALDGALHLRTGAFDASATMGDEVEIATGASRAGQFSAVTASGDPMGDPGYTAAYTATEARMLVADTLAPPAPSPTATDAHVVGSASNDPSIEVSWAAVADGVGGTGLEEYWYSISPNAGDIPGAGNATTETTATLTAATDGEWWIHVAAVDGAGNVGTGHVGPFTIDTAAPPTTLASSGPSGLVSSTTATFAFSSTDLTASFECKLNDSAFAPCVSPKVYTGLSDGQHAFQVRAKDAAGNTDDTPEARAFSVDATAPALAFITQPSSAIITSFTALAFGTGDSATVECSLNNAPFTACISPVALTGMQNGAHTFVVRGTDAVGNASLITATWSVEIPGVAPKTDDPALPAPPAAGRLIGGVGNDTIKGTKANDKIRGGKGNDKLSGEAGNDTIDGGPGNDIIDGGKGSDKIKGGPGKDSVKGSDGNDTIDVADDTDSDVVDCGRGKKDRVKLGKRDRQKNCEIVKRVKR